MKTLRLLATLLIVALCAGFSSCEKDLEKVPVDVWTPEEPNQPPSLDKLFSEYIENSKDISCKTYSTKNDSVTLSGLKKGHIWFAYFDKNSKKTFFEWEDTEITDTIQKIHTGYGEYETFIIRRVLPTILKQTNNNFIASIGFERASTLVFNQNNKMKKTGLFTEGDGKLWNWYKESIAINGCCYTSEGDTLFTYGDNSVDFDLDYKMHPLGMPISYYEGIYIDRFFRILYKSNYNPKICPNKGWHYALTNGVSDFYSCDFDIPRGCKWTCDLIDNSSNIWKYKITTITKDGVRDYYEFSINIENAYTVHNNAEIVGTWNEHIGFSGTFKLKLNNDNTYTFNYKEYTFSKEYIANGTYLWDKNKSILVLNGNALFPILEIVKLSPSLLRIRIDSIRDFFPALKRE